MDLLCLRNPSAAPTGRMFSSLENVIIFPRSALTSTKLKDYDSVMIFFC